MCILLINIFFYFFARGINKMTENLIPSPEELYKRA